MIKYTSSNEPGTIRLLLPVLNRMLRELGNVEVKPGQMTLTEIVHATEQAREELALRHKDGRAIR